MCAAFARPISKGGLPLLLCDVCTPELRDEGLFQMQLPCEVIINCRVNSMYPRTHMGHSRDFDRTSPR